MDGVIVIPATPTEIRIELARLDGGNWNPSVSGLVRISNKKIFAPGIFLSLSNLEDEAIEILNDADNNSVVITAEAINERLISLNVTFDNLRLGKHVQAKVIVTRTSFSRYSDLLQAEGQCFVIARSDGFVLKTSIDHKTGDIYEYITAYLF